MVTKKQMRSSRRRMQNRRYGKYLQARAAATEAYLQKAEGVLAEVKKKSPSMYEFAKRAIMRRAARSA